MLRNALLSLFFAVTLTWVEGYRPAIAHEGHDHGDQSAMASLPVAPRAAVATDDFEVVVAAAQGRLVIYLDHFESNEPVVGATVELIEDDRPTKADESAAGVYTINGWTRPPGVYSLMVAIAAGEKSDLLPLSLEIPSPVAPAGSGYPTLWVVIGQTASIAAFAFVLAAVYLRATRRFDYVLDSSVRFSDTALLLSTTVSKSVTSVRTRRLGPALITDRLWDQTGCGEAIKEVARDTAFDFPLERAVYATVLQRMYDNEPNRPVREWLDDHVASGTDKISDARVAAALEWLGQEPEKIKGGNPSGRATKDLIEEKLFSRRDTNEAGLDLVFFNTLPVPIAVRTKRHKSARQAENAPAMAVGVVLDASGLPVCYELWPGGSLDMEAMLAAIDRLRSRFDIRRVCLVSDLGISKPGTIDAFDDRGIQFILGLRDNEADLRSRLLNDPRPLESVAVSNGTHEKTEIAVKEVAPDEAWTPGRERFIVCSETIVSSQNGQDAEPADGEEPASGHGGPKPKKHYVLRTNTDLSPAEIVTRYRQLLVVEETFQAAKAILDMRTMPAVGEAMVRGHMFCSFLALLLRREIEVSLAAAGVALTWREVVRDLNRLAETELIQGGRRFALRNEPSANLLSVANALSVALPPTIERQGDDGAAPIMLDALTLPDRLRTSALRAGSAAISRAEQRVREVGAWLERQH